MWRLLGPPKGLAVLTTSTRNVEKAHKKWFDAGIQVIIELDAGS
jgi:hypothetical protein